jgi:hypothetical protein
MFSIFIIKLASMWTHDAASKNTRSTAAEDVGGACSLRASLANNGYVNFQNFQTSLEKHMFF